MYAEGSSDKEVPVLLLLLSKTSQDWHLGPPLLLLFTFVCFFSETDIYQPLFPLEVLFFFVAKCLQHFQFSHLPAGAVALRSFVGV